MIVSSPQRLLRETSPALNDADDVAVLAKDLGDRVPAGAVDEGAVDKNDVFRGGGRLRLGGRRGGQSCQHGGSDEVSAIFHVCPLSEAP